MLGRIVIYCGPPEGEVVVLVGEHELELAYLDHLLLSRIGSAGAVRSAMTQGFPENSAVERLRRGRKHRSGCPEAAASVISMAQFLSWFFNDAHSGHGRLQSN
jgi:hypothetical protein